MSKFFPVSWSKSPNIALAQAFFANSRQGPTQNVMLVDDNLLADFWACLRLTLACSAKSLRVILGKSEQNPTINGTLYDITYSYI